MSTASDNTMSGYIEQRMTELSVSSGLPFRTRKVERNVLRKFVSISSFVTKIVHDLLIVFQIIEQVRITGAPYALGQDLPGTELAPS